MNKYELQILEMGKIYVDHFQNCRERQLIHQGDTLYDSIQAYGLLIPVAVVPYDADGFTHKLIHGYRRYEAMKRLGEPQIPANVIYCESEHVVEVLNLIENIERDDLSQLDEARSIQRIFGDAPATEVAAELKKPVDWVRTRHRLLRMGEKIQKAAHAKRLSDSDINLLWATSGGDRTSLLNQILHRKTRRRRTHGKRPRKIKEMLVKVCDAGLIGMAPRALAWASGIITDEEFMADIEKLAALYNPLDKESQV